jgi:RNA polymerase sigma factor (sigma-70 family)
MHITMGVLYLLDDQSLDDLITAAQANATDDTVAMAAILRRFEGAVRAVARSVTTDWHLQQDAAQGARLGLVKAVRAHTPRTPGFTTYAWRYMKGAAIRLVATMRSDEITTDPQEPGWTDEPPEDVPVHTTVEVVDLIGVLKPEQQAVAVAYYVMDLRLNDIAASLGISKPAVSQRLSTIRRALRPVVAEALAA